MVLSLLKESVEYEKFIAEFSERKLTRYEKVCKYSEKILQISPGVHEYNRLQEAIDFCHLNISPKGSFSLAILAPILFSALSISSSLIFGFFSISVAVLTIFFSAAIFFYFYNLPYMISTSFRIKASAEMVLAIIYMSIAMKVIPNIEFGVRFAATNLTGPLAKDLRKLLWDVYIEKYVSVGEALDDFIKKWRRESEEFTDAIYLLKTSFLEKVQDRNKVLNEAIRLVLNGTRERMEGYVRELKTKVMILNALGILSPIISLVFFTLVEFILPNLIKPAMLILIYNIILPLLVYWVMKTTLEKRPSTLHQIDLSKHPKFAGSKMQKPVLFLSIFLPTLISGYAALQILNINQIFSFDAIIYSLTISWAIAFGIIFYSFFTVLNQLPVRKEIARIESELSEVLLQLGFQLKRGMPIEGAVRASLPRIRELKISYMFEKMLYNMENMGMSFEKAIFDKYVGAINFFPSRIVEVVMKAIVDVSKEGIKVLSSALLSISSFLKDVHSVEESLQDKLSDSVSQMEVQATLLAPLASGVFVAIAALLMQMMLSLYGVASTFQETYEPSAISLAPPNDFLRGILDLNNVVKVHNFQLIVAVYMLEVVGLIAIFLSTIKNGNDKLLIKFSIGKSMLIASAVYSAVFLLTFAGVGSFIPLQNFIR